MPSKHRDNPEYQADVQSNAVCFSLVLGFWIGAILGSAGKEWGLAVGGTLTILYLFAFVRTVWKWAEK